MDLPCSSSAWEVMTHFLASLRPAGESDVIRETESAEELGLALGENASPGEQSCL